MRKGLHLLLALGLAVALIGCQSATEKKPPSPPSESGKSTTEGTTSSTQGESGEVATVAATLVNLKVPNMV